ncbi:MAG: aminotransferase class I/II-fold pyridoxal phosphate-dependent enzyme [Sphingobacteriales bacterium]|nr:aminotransferase class I/II-fold pyridoxal phosphate-dependent enzyme [Sphingobacteriales bacterium]MBK6890500.1 aminotransferase class I/II-fold pyridoxal phosphate-dependent enzyme [Sphingobacteriales bacterium]MBK7526449.1 aminotransferase class I/II-fold pyridoxal phosphate-dependent enzyme [Sphingobacteriales bacterium]MBK8679985.1 aminotransferase class I/II-fold pyridoxal phosphate-dependent enzyme [Sphingobacteriales bacterium]MBL0247535.1 aminotransferase class I/II-fold pyridoxal p
MSNEAITLKLNELSKLSRQLDPPEPERVELINSVVNYANQFIEGLGTVTAFRNKDANSLEITNEKHPLSELLSLYQKQVAETGINAASGKHLGYIPGGGVFSAALADFIAAVTNPFASVYFASPGAATLENEVVNWLKSVFSFPKNAVGCLSSGGSISTLIAFTAARDRHKIKNERIPKSVVYLSEQVHHSTQKALRIIGLEDIIIRCLPLDDRHRIKADLLETQIEKDILAGLYPFLVVATAGTTDTGAVDPLEAIAAIAQKYKIWFHVDAAYGGFFIMTATKKAIFKGIEKANSLIVDPHKGLFLPYGVGAVLVKDSDAVLHSNYYTANYMQDVAHDEEMLKSPANLSPELTKHFRGLRVWLPLQLHGIEPFIACLEEKLLLVKYFRNKLKALGFCLGPEPDLSASYFWYPFETEADKKNKLLMDEIHADGAVFLSSSIINNRFVIRIAILAFRTKKEIVDETIEMIKRCLIKVHKFEQNLC